MFCRAGQIVDIFIPVEQGGNKSTGFAFVRFATNRKALAIDLAVGRSWGGRKIQVNMARFILQGPETLHKKIGLTKAYVHRNDSPTSTSLEDKEPDAKPSSSGVAGWIVDDGKVRWVIRKQRKTLFCSLISFLKSKSRVVVQAEVWLESSGGRMPVKIQVLDDQVVWMEFLSEKEADEVL